NCNKSFWSDPSLAKKQTNKKNIYEHLRENETYMKKRLGTDVSFDIDFREIVILDTKLQIYYVNGLVDDAAITQLLKKLISINDDEVESDDVWEIVKNRFVNQQVEVVPTLDEAVDQLLSGLIVVFVDGF